MVWICRDGVGMLTSLSVAYGYAHTFEADAGTWRLGADTLNNMGLFCNMLVSIYPAYYMTLGCMSAVCFSCCGLIAGATKAHISSHFVVRNHDSSCGHATSGAGTGASLADITAKESTQETAVTLIGLLLGLLFTGGIGSNVSQAWCVFICLTCIHQYANYRLIKVLVFDTLNPQRCYLITNTLLQDNVGSGDGDDGGGVSTNINIDVNEVSGMELLYRPAYLYWWGPQVGVSIDQIVLGVDIGKVSDHSEMEVGTEMEVDLDCLLYAWQRESFIIGIDRWGRICVCIEYDYDYEQELLHLDVDVDKGLDENKNKSMKLLKSYFIACYLLRKWDEVRNRNASTSTDFYRFLLEPEHNRNPEHKSKSNVPNPKPIPIRIQEALNWYNSILFPKLIEYQWDVDNSLGCIYNQQFSYSFKDKNN